ncbi:MAG: hypothetical protein ACYC64_20155 [Armatimonadota bacterium]
MSMILTLETDRGISEFVMKPIDRKGRQTVTKKLAVDSQGRECSRALMTYDGLLLGSGSVSDMYEDLDGNTIEHGDVVQADFDGNILRNLPSTIGRPQRPVGPTSIEELLGHTVAKAYALAPIAIALDFQESLAQGDIYRVAYRPRASVVDNPAFILANTSSVFLLQCKPCLIEFIRLDQPIVLEDAINDEDDLWDDWPTNTPAANVGSDVW